MKAIYSLFNQKVVEKRYIILVSLAFLLSYIALFLPFEYNTITIPADESSHLSYTQLLFGFNHRFALVNSAVLLLLFSAAYVCAVQYDKKRRMSVFKSLFVAVSLAYLTLFSLFMVKHFELSNPFVSSAWGIGFYCMLVYSLIILYAGYKISFKKIENQ